MKHRSLGFASVGTVSSLCLLAFASVAWSIQIPDGLKKKLLEGTDMKSLTSPENEADGIDNSIDPDTYMIGGGDAFQISIVGLPSQDYHPVVGQDGNLYHGELGMIKLGRISLTQAKEVIRKHVQTIMRRNYEVYVALRALKKPIVTVSGAIASPGTFQVPGTSRLLDVLKMAHRGALPALDEFDYRQVEVSNRDSVRTYDLLKFISRHDLSQNPYLYPGDNISIRLADSRVYVTGAVLPPIQGWTSLKPGETLSEFLSILQLKRGFDSSRIMLQQASPSGKSGMMTVGQAEGGSLVLQNGDLLSIPMAVSLRKLDTATVTGEVLYPGTYPVSAGTTVADVLKAAGGPTAEGNAARAYVIRMKLVNSAGKTLADDPEGSNAFLRRQAAAAVQLVRPEINASLNDLNQSNDFSIIEIGGRAGDIQLEEGDRVFVPKKEKFLYVSGSVGNPGAYPYVAGKGYDYYVDQAGGYARKADKNNLYALGFYQGATKIKDVDRLAEGDVLVVPAAIEYKRFSTVVLPILQIVPAVLSLVVSIIILNR